MFIFNLYIYGLKAIVNIMRIILLLFFVSSFLVAQGTSSISNGEENKFHRVTAIDGDGVIKILSRYGLYDQGCNVEKFYELNNLTPGDALLKGKQYFLPVIIFAYNGKSIRSTIGDDNWDKAVRISKFNKTLKENNLRKSSYKTSNILWVPFNELNCSDSNIDTAKRHTKLKTAEVSSDYTFRNESIFGKKYEKIKIRSNTLEGRVFYIVSGHGGPDPGAMAEVNNSFLCEDEYAYDVSLRLARALMEQGALVHIVVQDEFDGIRDEEMLVCDKNEKYETGATIPLNQIERLHLRADIINDFYKVHKNEGKLDQTVVCIHVDSRSPKRMQDVFFYYFKGSKSSMKLAYNLQNTFEDKYKKYRSNGEYHGTVTTRPLYMLKHTDPKAVYVELANIRNPSDRRRLLPASNRQALANWLYEGLVRK